MNDPARTTEEAAKYDLIYKNARAYYENILNKPKNTIPNYNFIPNSP